MVFNIINKGVIKKTMENLDKNKHFVIVKQTKYKFNYNIATFVDYFNTDKYSDATITDLIGFLSLNIDSVLPIPIINDRFITKNQTISNFPGLLIIVFINISKLNHTHPGGSLNYLMNLLNNNNLSVNNIFQNMFNPNELLNTPDNIQQVNQYQNHSSEQYSEQIDIMKNMGFSDENKILESLIVSEGDVNNAIQYYLGS